jgi:hypothetical protein
LCPISCPTRFFSRGRNLPSFTYVPEGNHLARKLPFGLKPPLPLRGSVNSLTQKVENAFDDVLEPAIDLEVPDTHNQPSSGGEIAIVFAVALDVPRNLAIPILT